MATNTEYKRLPGRAGSIYRQSLWLASDHVLSVVNRGYSEDYKRFYYKDVRAIQVRKTSLYLVLNALLGSFAGICLLVQSLAFLVWKWTEGGQVAFGIITAIFVVSEAINLLLGPTCAVHLYTAVHTEPMPALGRLRSANRAIAQLRVRIEAIQGTLAPDLMERSHSIFAPAPDPAIPSPKPEQPLHEYSGNFHWSLFALLLFNALLIVVGCFRREAVLQVLATVVYTALGVCMIGALIRQRHTRVGKGLRRLAWASVIYVWFVSVISSMIAFIMMFEGKFTPGHFTYTDVIREMMKLVPAEHPALLVLALFSAACSLALGLAGIVLMMQFRKEIH